MVAILVRRSSSKEGSVLNGWKTRWEAGGPTEKVRKFRAIPKESEVGDSLLVRSGMLQLAAQLVPRPSSPPPLADLGRGPTPLTCRGRRGTKLQPASTQSFNPRKEGR